jgi:hypothetical protein
MTRESPSKHGNDIPIEVAYGPDSGVVVSCLECMLAHSSAEEVLGIDSCT